MGRGERAFEVAQRAQARALQDLLAEAEVDLRFRADPRFQEREREILERIAAADAGDGPDAADGARLEDELSVLEATLREQDARYADLRYPSPCPPAEVRARVLQPHEVLLQYMLGERASYVWLIARDRFRFEALPPQREIEARVRELLPLLRDYNVLGDAPEYLVAPARALYDMLLGPVADDLEGAARVRVVPDGVLHYLPFEVLLTRAPGERERTFATLPYLAREAVVGYAPSVGVLDLLRRARPGGSAPASGALLVGDPAGAAPGDLSVLAPAAELRHAGAEIERVAARFPPGTVLTLRGPRATALEVQRAAEAGAYRFVHFAVHGYLNDRRPQFSGLLLGADPAARDDGFLTIGRVFGLELRGGHVVLSACSSALGEEVTGEGLVGLTRAFLYAGGRGVVAALWEIPDASAAEFMAAFYAEACREGSPDAAAALAAAKRAMIARGRAGAPEGLDLAHPHCWAGFTLSGDDR
jgi:CHAT domain-containing protein